MPTDHLGLISLMDFIILYFYCTNRLIGHLDLASNLSAKCNIFETKWFNFKKTLLNGVICAEIFSKSKEVKLCFQVTLKIEDEINNTFSRSILSRNKDPENIWQFHIVFTEHSWSYAKCNAKRVVYCSVAIHGNKLILWLFYFLCPIHTIK